MTKTTTPARYAPARDELQRDIDDLLALLATAHRNLDAAGVPRTTPT